MFQIEEEVKARMLRSAATTRIRAGGVGLHRGVKVGRSSFGEKKPPPHQNQRGIPTSRSRTDLEIQQLLQERTDPEVQPRSTVKRVHATHTLKRCDTQARGGVREKDAQSNQGGAQPWELSAL
jgi:hypothetical protein